MKRKALQHKRLPEGASAPLNREQKGLGQNERRVCRNPHIRGCLSEAENVLYHEGRRKKYQKSKGCKKSVIKKQIKHEQYKKTLFGTQQMWHGMNILRSEGHEIYGMHVNKISLSPFDSKRWIADDGVNTKAYGYNTAWCLLLVYTSVTSCQCTNFVFQ